MNSYSDLEDSGRLQYGGRAWISWGRKIHRLGALKRTAFVYFACGSKAWDIGTAAEGSGNIRLQVSRSHSMSPHRLKFSFSLLWIVHLCKSG